MTGVASWVVWGEAAFRKSQLKQAEMTKCIAHKTHYTHEWHLFFSRRPILWQYSASLRRFANKIIIESKYFSLDGDCSVFCIFRKTWQHIIWNVSAKVPSPFYSLNLHWWFLVECWRLMSLECWAKLEHVVTHAQGKEDLFSFLRSSSLLSPSVNGFLPQSSHGNVSINQQTKHWWAFTYDRIFLMSQKTRT